MSSEPHDPAQTPDEDPSAPAETRVTAQPGDVIGSRYEVERELGGGATGNVFLVHDRLLKKPIEAKTLVHEVGR